MFEFLALWHKQLQGYSYSLFYDHMVANNIDIGYYEIVKRQFIICICGKIINGYFIKYKNNKTKEYYTNIWKWNKNEKCYEYYINFGAKTMSAF